MPNALKVVLWSVLSLGMLFLAIMAFWVFIVIIGVIILVRVFYLRLFKKGSITVHTYKTNYHPSGPPPREGNENRDQAYTTVIDADDPEKEYKIPKIK